MLAAVIIISIFLLFITYAFCKAAGEADKWEEKWIEQRKKEDKEGKDD